MAQPSARVRRLLLRRRFGLDGAKGVVAACLVVTLGATGVGVARAAADTGVVISRSDEVTSEASPSPDAETQVPAPMPSYVVHVDGAVASPGVYEVSGDDARVMDAVDAAGGLLEDADTTGVNLASPLVDGSKIHVPSSTEAAPEADSTSGGSSSAAIGLVNINMATEAELCSLPGVGEATARSIVRERETNGPFVSAEDIMRVSGIGEKKFARIRDLICV